MYKCVIERDQKGNVSEYCLGVIWAIKEKKELYIVSGGVGSSVYLMDSVTHLISGL